MADDFPRVGTDAFKDEAVTGRKAAEFLDESHLKTGSLSPGPRSMDNEILAREIVRTDERKERSVKEEHLDDEVGSPRTFRRQFMRSRFIRPGELTRSKLMLFTMQQSNMDQFAFRTESFFPISVYDPHVAGFKYSKIVDPWNLIGTRSLHGYQASRTQTGTEWRPVGAVWEKIMSTPTTATTDGILNLDSGKNLNDYAQVIVYSTTSEHSTFLLPKFFLQQTDLTGADLEAVSIQLRNHGASTNVPMRRNSDTSFVFGTVDDNDSDIVVDAIFGQVDFGSSNSSFNFAGSVDSFLTIEEQIGEVVRRIVNPSPGGGGTPPPPGQPEPDNKVHVHIIYTVNTDGTITIEYQSPGQEPLVQTLPIPPGIDANTAIGQIPDMVRAAGRDEGIVVDNITETVIDRNTLAPPIDYSQRNRTTQTENESDRQEIYNPVTNPGGYIPPYT